MKKRQWILVIAAGTICLAAVAVGADWLRAVPKEARATYVGRQTCAECHRQQHEQWTGSHHDLAMDHATPETVLANFDDQTITYQGVTSRMFRREGKYFIHTEGPDGEMADFEIKYVFGVEPLQQYMVEFPDGRVQVLRISWDTERKRWFYHYPPDVIDEKLEPDDPLHWSNRASNWNHMCAECHSTDVRKNFDVAKKRYGTTFFEIDVGCETCHGPGSIHVELAKAKSLFWDRNHGYGLPRLKDENTRIEIESCAKCHSRRRVVAGGFQSGEQFLDHYVPATLRPELYHADGQILDEVYVYGSFLQSKMYAKDVRCTDCHDPHTTKLKHEGNRVCTSCHQHPEGKYDVPAHHFHPVGSKGASCVECHMPAKHYMIVDPRRDHSIRVPRPDLSVDLGTPNACTQCHLEMQQAAKSDKGFGHYADWLAARDGDDPEKAAIADAEIARIDREMLAAVKKWYGEKRDRKPHFAYALAAARAGKPEAEIALTEVLADREQPAIVRATVVEHLAQLNTGSAQRLVLGALEDKEPLVRATAARGLEQGGYSREQLAKSLAPLLKDEVRLVRVEAAQVLASAFGALNAEQRVALLAAIEEFKAGQLVDSDQAAAHYNLGNLSADLGESEAAVRQYKTALGLDERFVRARYNLGVLHGRIGEDIEAEEQFRVLTKQQPEMALGHYRLGLALAKLRRFVEAERELLKAHEIEPGTFDYMYGLSIFYREHREWDNALKFAQKLIARYPQSRPAQQLLREVAQRVPPSKQ